jgi:hypothetical protein
MEKINYEGVATVQEQEQIDAKVIDQLFTADTSDPSRVRVDFVVAGSTMHEAIRWSRSTDAIEAGMSVCRKNGLRGIGVSDYSATVFPCNKNGEPDTASLSTGVAKEYKDENGNPVHYVRVSRTYIGEI